MNSTNNNAILKKEKSSYILDREISRRKQIEDCAQIAGLEWDIETNEFWWSQNLYKIVNLDIQTLPPSLNALIGLFRPSDQAKVQKHFETLSQQGGSFRFYTHTLSRQGQETPVLLMAKADAQTHKMIGFVQDVGTDFKERESLLETLAKYRGVMSGAGDAIILLSHEGNIIEGNPKAAELLEVLPDNLSQLSVDDIHDQQELDIMMGYYQGFLWGQDQSARSTIIGKKGKKTPVEISGRSIEIGSQQMLVVIMRDITVQQQAQNALIRSEQRYRSLVDEAREGIMLLTSDGNILAVNPKLCESTGLKRSVLLQSNFRDITDFDMEISPTEILMEANTRSSIHMEGNLQTADGKLLPTGFNVARYKDQGQVQFIVTAYDLTNVRSSEEDRLELQKQLFQAQKQELLGQVAGSLAHDFNNLLSPILLVSEMLMEDAQEDPFLHGNLRNIHQAAERARRLVHRILTYTRPEESEPTRIELRHEMEETLALLRSSIPQTIKIDEICNDESYYCFADPDQIHQVIMNTGMNAAQAIGEEKGVITFAMQKIYVDENSELISRFEIPEGDYVTVCISDTGPGIPQHILNEIFDPFFTTKTQTDGSGLGLSVVRQIVENHGGAVEAIPHGGCLYISQNKEQTIGACICIYLPLLKE